MADNLIENAFGEFLSANELRVQGWSQEQLDLLSDAFRDGFAIGNLTRDNPNVEHWRASLQSAASIKSVGGRHQINPEDCNVWTFKLPCKGPNIEGHVDPHHED